MNSVWLVWRRQASIAETVVAVCADEADACGAALEQQRWLERYHGPDYPCEWQQLLGERRFSNQYGDVVYWEERAVWQPTSVPA